MNDTKKYRLKKEYPCLNPEPYIIPIGTIYEWDGTKYISGNNTYFFKEMVEGLSAWFEPVIDPPAAIRIDHLTELHGVQNDVFGLWYKFRASRKIDREKMLKAMEAAANGEQTAGVKYDKDFGDDRVCECGHKYYRHFDTYENMRPVGCKYCGCDEFVARR